MSMVSLFEIPYPGAVENEDYYIVKDGDTLADIAYSFLGDDSLAPLLTQLNGVDETTILQGMVLMLHPEEE